MYNEYSGETTAIEPAGWPKPIGVLSLVFGILAVSCGVLGVGSMFLMNDLMGSMMSGQLPPGTPPPPFTPPMDAVMIVSMGLGLLVNTLLIIAGIQLLKRRQSGRTLHLVYALVAVLAAFVGTYATYVSQQAQQAEMAAWIEQHGDANDATRQIADQQQMSAQMQGPVQAISVIFGLVVALAWPVFCIIWFGMVKKVVPPRTNSDGGGTGRVNSSKRRATSCCPAAARPSSRPRSPRP